MTKEVDELKKRVDEIEKKEGIRDGIRVRCVALWSVILAFLVFVGKMSADNSDILKAAANTAWEVWRKKNNG